MHTMVTLAPMSDAAFDAWSPRTWANYKADLLRAGFTEDAADENIRQTIAGTMQDGRPGSGQHVFEVHEDGETVGAVWLAERGTDWFIYDLEIDSEHRGKGLGRAAMRAIEDFVRTHGGTSIGLSVFGFNTVAQRLYESEGYDTVRRSMSKRLD